MMKKLSAVFCFVTISILSLAQDSATAYFHPDSSLRIININPYFSLHVDSTLAYQLQINKNPENYFWYLKNAPVGLRIGKDDGVISFRASKAYFLSGKLKYDVPYRVAVGVQNLADPKDKVDTSFSVTFFNTDVVMPKIKPTVFGSIWIDEGETVSFKVLCEAGNFPIENVMMTASVPITNYTVVQKCGDEFNWTPNYDFAKATDSGKIKPVLLSFIGTGKMGISDTATVRVFVRDALNQPMAVQEYNQVAKNVDHYVLQLKYTFVLLDKKLKKTRNARVTFDLTSASTSLTGTIMSTSGSEGSQRTGKILPSVGLALVPIKEASVPSKVVDQNQASQIRSSIKRLEYVRFDNQLVNDKDTEVLRKMAKLKDELKQVQMQLIDVPLEFTNDLSEEELNRYFNSPKVNKKYRLKS